MRFDLADLSLFRHVVEAGSITHGAERAHLALAAASTRVRNMEDALGVPLLTRGRQGVSGYLGKFLSDALKFTIVLAEAARVSNGQCGIRASKGIPTMTPVVWVLWRSLGVWARAM